MAEFDIAVIGAGASGLSMTYAAARLGLRTVLIERARMGGDCLNAGCVPSKALLAAAHAAEDARRAHRLGVRLAPPEIDWDGVRAHVRRAIDTIAPTDSEARYSDLGALVLKAAARFTAPDTLNVDGRRITARRIVIAAGSRPALPNLDGLDRVPYLTNETLFEMREKPEHLLILGGGPIGLEMAQAHAGLGCRVSVIEGGRIAGRDDPELVAPLRAALVRQGVALFEDARAASVSPDGAGLCLVLGDGQRIAGSHLLIAVGRRPNIEELGLDAGNVRYGPRGIATDHGLRSPTNSRVFAIGDIANPDGIGPRAFTHVGGYHAGLVVRRAIFRLPARLDYGTLPRVTYTAPELAQVGPTEVEAEKAGHTVSVHRWKMADNDRAIAEADTAGLVKLVTSRGRLIGAGIVAPRAGEMVGVCSLAIARGLKPSVLAGMIVPYPTRAEAWKRAAGTVYSERLFAPRTQALARLLLRLRPGGA